MAIYMQFTGTIPAHDNYKQYKSATMGMQNEQIK